MHIESPTTRLAAFVARKDEREGSNDIHITVDLPLYRVTCD